MKDIDHQLILAFSLEYSRLPTLVPFLSTKIMKENDFIHADQGLALKLIEADISFPLIVLWKKSLILSKFYDEDFEYLLKYH